MKNIQLFRFISGFLAGLLLISCSRSSSVIHNKIDLKENWRVQQSAKLVGLRGERLSGTTINISSWLPAHVPSTVMGILTANGQFKDIFIADSIKNVDSQQFESSWWYRNEFNLPDFQEEQHIMLCFEGISYYANIWLNGTQIGSRDSVFGSFSRFEFDITNLIKDSINVLAVEVFKQKQGDLGYRFFDWNPKPPDNNMGLLREVYVKITGHVGIKNTYVRSDVNTASLSEASLTIITDLVNYSNRSINGKLAGKIDGVEFSIPVNLKAGESKNITITPAEVDALRISNPRLWWCNNMGEPNLYNLNIQYITNKHVSDAGDISFGIREIEDYISGSGHRGFKLNGKEVLIKGAVWSDDIFLGDTPEKNKLQVQYVKHMNLNTIRFENSWGASQNIYDLCDQYGIIVMGSDKLPRPALERRYRELISAIDGRPYLAAATVVKSENRRTRGVKMKGPYNYVGPSYWYIDSLKGEDYGFNMETSPGPQVPVLETIERMLPPDKRWPINDMWNFHYNPSESVDDLSIFNSVMNRRYGQPNSLPNYLLKADVQSYEAIKGRFEAFRANRPKTTGIIQWMLNSAWPSFYGQLYDYYLLPTAAYYAVKKANAPVQLVYNYGNHQVYAVNSTLKAFKKAIARIKLVDIQGNVISSDERIINLEENKSVTVYKVPPYYSTVFLSMTLLDDRNQIVSDNFYWLAGNPDVYDWEKTDGFYTPIKSSADFRALNYLPPAQIELIQQSSKSETDQVIETRIINNSNRIAFFMNIVLKDSVNHTVFPVFWDDNYISLLPGESRNLHCTIPGSLDTQMKYTFAVSGWNVKEQIINAAL